MIDRARRLLEPLGARVRTGVPLAELTTWRIGGPADLVVAPSTASALHTALLLAEQAALPVHLIGNGSNLLAPDAGLRGMVVHLAGGPAATRWSGERVVVEAGAFLPKLAREAASRGLAGLECVVGVPGTVGGGIVQNAGIPDATLGEVTEWVLIRRPGGDIEQLPGEAMGFAHRASRLHHEAGVVLAAGLRLRADDSAAVGERMDRHLAHRRATQPLTLPSAGSVFRRPADGPPPGRLLEQCGCKGLREGGAEVSALHANWIVNRGGATAADVRRLIEIMQRRVAEEFGLELIPEVTML